MNFRTRDTIKSRSARTHYFRISDFGLPSALGSRPSDFFPLLAFLPLVCLTACKEGPDYHRPAPLVATPVPSGFSATTNASDWKPAVPASHLPRGTWWQVFADAKLDGLENLAGAGNQQLAAALARIEQARASVDVQRAGLFPQVELDPSYTRQRTSVNQPDNGHPAGAAYTFNTFTMQLQAGWELDLWGRVRRGVESARAQLRANADDLESVKLSLQAEVATDYFTLRALDAEYDLLTRTAETYRRSLGLTVNRRKGGIATDLDVSQAQTQLRATEAQLPALQLERTKLVHALATLCGQSATDFELKKESREQNGIPDYPISLPSELLERRPDIAAAEQRMAAANAQVGVAQSAFYPRVRLNGVAGLQSLDASTWFDWPSRFWAVGPSLQMPLFTGGLNRAQLAVARASYDETVANYRQTVLSAFQEVEDQLVSGQLLSSQLQAEASAVEAAQRTLEIANNRYRAGLVTYLEVATAQGAALDLERSTVQLRGQKLVSAVGLIKALGGGWQAPQDETAMK